MANLEHIKKLKMGVASWNDWRDENPQIKPDLSNLVLCGDDIKDFGFAESDFIDPDVQEPITFAILDGINFKECNLEGIKLNDAQLSGAIFDNANIKNAEFDGACLERASFYKANLEKVNFKSSYLFNADLRGSNIREVDFRYANIRHSLISHSIIADSKFTHADLNKSDFSWSTLENVNFKSAKLNMSECRETRFINCDFTEVYCSHLKCARGIDVSTCLGSPRFKRLAQDQDFIEEFKEINPLLYQIWSISSDCGRSITRWSFWSVILSLFYAIVFYLIGENSFELDYLPWNLSSMIYYSVVTFTTLGFGDIKPTSNLAAWIVMSEVVIGYVMLGGLISILATKLARRS